MQNLWYQSRDHDKVRLDRLAEKRFQHKNLQYQPLREASEAPPWALHLMGGLALMQVKWKISNLAATKYHIVRRKCIKFDFH